MNVEQFRDCCLAKLLATEEFPFDKSTLVFKVAGKIFGLTSLDGDDFRINLKCDPEKSLELRAQHSSIIPGFHMNKKHWNTIIVDDRMNQKLLLSLIDHSYNLVVKSLPNKIKAELEKKS